MEDDDEELYSWRNKTYNLVDKTVYLDDKKRCWYAVECGKNDVKYGEYGSVTEDDIQKPKKSDTSRALGEKRERELDKMEKDLARREKELALQTIDLKKREDALKAAVEEFKARVKDFEESSGESVEVANLLG